MCVISTQFIENATVLVSVFGPHAAHLCLFAFNINANPFEWKCHGSHPQPLAWINRNDHEASPEKHKAHHVNIEYMLFDRVLTLDE